MDLFNKLRPRWNWQHFADDIFKRIFFNENVWISFKVSLKFVPNNSINNIAALVQIMAWCRPGDKPLSERTMVSLPTHICVTRPQWIKSLTEREITDCFCNTHKMRVDMKCRLTSVWISIIKLRRCHGHLISRICIISYLLLWQMVRSTRQRHLKIYVLITSEWKLIIPCYVHTHGIFYDLLFWQRPFTHK